MRMPTSDSAVLVLGLLALGSSGCSDPVTSGGEEPFGAWAPLGDGVATGSPAIAIHQGDLVVGGRFEGPGDGSGILRWSGTGWQPMGPLQSWLDGANGATIEDLRVHGGSLYAAVRFPAPGTQGGIVVRWVGDGWEEVGDAADPTLRALTVYDGALHAGGNGVSRWDGTDWVRIEGSPLHVYAFGEYEGGLRRGHDRLERCPRCERFLRYVRRLTREERGALGRLTRPGRDHSVTSGRVRGTAQPLRRVSP